MAACDRERVDEVLADLADDRVHGRRLGELVAYLVAQVDQLAGQLAEVERRAGVRPAPGQRGKR